jgi:hypothetical protein
MSDDTTWLVLCCARRRWLRLRGVVRHEYQPGGVCKLTLADGRVLTSAINWKRDDDLRCATISPTLRDEEGRDVFADPTAYGGEFV